MTAVLSRYETALSLEGTELPGANVKPNQPDIVHAGVVENKNSPASVERDSTAWQRVRDLGARAISAAKEYVQDFFIGGSAAPTYNSAQRAELAAQDRAKTQLAREQAANLRAAQGKGSMGGAPWLLPYLGVTPPKRYYPTFPDSKN